MCVWVGEGVGVKLLAEEAWRLGESCARVKSSADSTDPGKSNKITKTSVFVFQFLLKKNSVAFFSCLVLFIITLQRTSLKSYIMVRKYSGRSQKHI